MRKATFEEVDEVADIGEVIAHNVVDFFADKNNQKEIDSLLQVGVKIKEEAAAKTSKLAGLTFVLTGTLPNYSRSDMSRLIEENGGKTASSVSKNTSYVLAGEEAGSKLQKAKELGIKIIDESEILKMMK